MPCCGGASSLNKPGAKPRRNAWGAAGVRCCSPQAALGVPSLNASCTVSAGSLHVCAGQVLLNHLVAETPLPLEAAERLPYSFSFSLYPQLGAA